MSYDYILKIILVGSHSTGKTCFFHKLLKIDTFINAATIGVDFGSIYKKRNDELLKIHIWDTAGQERFRAIILNYFRGISGVFLFFDLNNLKSFESLEYWINNIENNNKCSHKHPIMLIGNKSDLEIKVKHEQIADFVNKHKLIYKQISVKNDDIDVLFTFMIDIIYNNFIINKIICPGVRVLNEIENTKIINEKKDKIKCCKY